MSEASITQPNLPFVGKVTITGILTTRTGLHVGAGGVGINPRGVDAPLIRDPMSQFLDQSGRTKSSLPYIPGSSLRGKLRMLLVRRLDKPVKTIAQAGERSIRLHFCQDENCEVCRLFGSVPPPDRRAIEEQASTSEPWSLPASLHVTDLRLKEPQQFVQSERKNENALDRITAHSNPRQIERIPQGTRFTLCFTYYVRRLDQMEEDLRNLLTTLSLLQDDTLGGHGSRGYGAVAVSFDKMEVQRFGVPAQQEQKKSYTLELPLERAREKMNQHLPEVETFLVSLPAVTVPQAKDGGEHDEVIRRVACLRFTSPLHVGEPRVGLEGCVDTVSSDTLFSALANAWVTLYGKQNLEDLLAEFKHAAKDSAHLPPFRLSSAFPYLDERFFFPKPFSSAGRWDEDEVETKALKDLKVLPADLFHKWITGGLTKTDFDDRLKQELEKQKKEKSSAKDILPRVRLDRLDLTSNLYFCGQVYFREEGGLYFLAEGKEAMLEKMHEALGLLGEIGLGGERALGFGRFEVRTWKRVQEIEALCFLVDGTNCDAFLTLSLYHPSPQEMPLLVSNRGENLLGYQLTERGGWVDSPELRFAMRKKTCRLFTEGSVFQTEPQGCLIDVTPEPVNEAPHHVYRYGFAFPVGIVRQ